MKRRIATKIGTGAVLGISSSTWLQPVLKQAVLAAHAETSTTATPTCLVSNTEMQLPLLSLAPSADVLAFQTTDNTVIAGPGLTPVPTGGSFTIDGPTFGVPADPDNDAQVRWTAKVDPSGLQVCDQTDSVECRWLFNVGLDAIADPGGLIPPLAANGGAVFTGGVVFDPSFTPVAFASIGVDTMPQSLGVGDTITLEFSFTATVAELPDYCMVFGSEWYTSRPDIGDHIFLTVTISDMAFYGTVV